MKDKPAARTLLLLLAAAVFAVGYFIFRSKSSQGASSGTPTILRNLSLSEDIEVHPQFSGISPQFSGLTKSEMLVLARKYRKYPAVFPREAEAKKLRSRLIKDVGRQLREGGVKFTPSLPPPSEDWVAPTPEQLKESERAGRLSVVANVYYVDGQYVGDIQVRLNQKVYLTLDPSSEVSVITWNNGSSYLSKFSAASQAELQPKLQAEIRHQVYNFIWIYRSANQLPPLPETDVNGIPIKNDSGFSFNVTGGV